MAGTNGVWTENLSFFNICSLGINALTSYLTEDALKDKECDLKYLDFLSEFAGTFGQLGTSLSQLRSREDFREFDFADLRQFIDADVYEIVQERVQN